MKLIFILLLIMTSYACKAQTLYGSYREKKMIGESTHTITFNGTTFKEEISGDILKKLGFGSYNLKDNKLVLNYKNYPEQDTSKYDIIYLNQSPHSNIDISIFDLDTIPLIANYGNRDVRDLVINMVSTDKNGKGNLLVFDNKTVGYFVIDCIGYHRISIPINRLMYNSVAIKAYLSPQKNYYIDKTTKVFKIIKTNEKKLILNDGQTSYIFEKLD